MKATKTKLFKMTATTFHGLEEVLAAELEALGATSIEILNRAVAFEGDKELMYKANLCLRTALRILKPIRTFTVRDPEALYTRMKTINWSRYMGLKDTLSVDSTVSSKFFQHSKYVALKTKDAIVDQFRTKYQDRPSINTEFPSLSINVFIKEDQCTVSLDSSGRSLHKRGYRIENYKAPINEALAAGMILLSEWKADCDFIDPMCGSGTLLTEAASIAYNMAPQKYREYFSFLHWKDFEAELWEKVKRDAKKAERIFEHNILGFDMAFPAIRVAERNIEKAKMSTKIKIKRKAFEKNVPATDKGVLIMNPPYGERIGPSDVNTFYRKIGDQLKKAYAGFDAWIISSNKEALRNIGLRPSEKIKLFNGPLECSYRKYEMYEGSLEDMNTLNSI